MRWQGIRWRLHLLRQQLHTATHLVSVVARARLKRLPALPPGNVTWRDAPFFTDDRLLMAYSGRYGPVFKLTMYGRLVIAVTDHRLSRKLLQEHVASLGPIIGPYSRLIPGGFLRSLSADVHRETRRAFVQCLKPELTTVHEDGLRQIARTALSEKARLDGPSTSGVPLLAPLRRISTDMLLLVNFGLKRGDEGFDAVWDAYERLGPNGFLWSPGPDQERAAAELMDLARGLVERCRQDPAQTRPSLLRNLVLGEPAVVGEGNIIGNFVYMIEMGRYDLYGLFNFIVYYLSRHPDVVSAIAVEGRSDPRQLSLSRASVMETLRLDQAENVQRRVQEDFVFEGHGIPRGSYVRGCMREGHRDANLFEDPETFNPHRFLEKVTAPGAFTPFGYDHHRCLAGDLVLTLATVMVQELVAGFRWQVTSDGPRHRNLHHWSPSPRFDVSLTSRDPAPALPS